MLWSVITVSQSLKGALLNNEGKLLYKSSTCKVPYAKEAADQRAYSYSYLHKTYFLLTTFSLILTYKSNAVKYYL